MTTRPLLPTPAVAPAPPRRVRALRRLAACAAIGGVLAHAAPAIALTRCEVLKDAESWVAAGVPYSQGIYGSYCSSNYCYSDPLRPAAACWRSDCSGFVSATWNVSTANQYSGRTTLGYAPFDTSVSYELGSHYDLLPGDALNSDGHIMLFGGWTGADTFFVYQESTCYADVGTTTAHRSDFGVGDGYIQTFHPIRFVDITPCNAPPIGALDEARCDLVQGWSQDPDTPDQGIDVHVYFDAQPGQPGAKARATHASLPRPDLCGAIGSCDHGYGIPLPAAFLDEQPHPVWAYGIDSSGGDNSMLPNSPRTVTCPRATLPLDPPGGVKRWVASAASFDAWRFDLLDVAPLTDATVIAYADGPALTDAPRVVQADDGTPEVWVVDGDVRRHVTDPGSLAAWKLGGAIEAMAAADVYARPKGKDWRPAPFLFRGGGAAVFVLDDAPDAPAGAGGAAGQAGSGAGGAWGGPAGGSAAWGHGGGIPARGGAGGDDGAIAGSACAYGRARSSGGGAPPAAVAFGVLIGLRRRRARRGQGARSAG